jgi:hypothetical protein
VSKRFGKWKLGCIALILAVVYGGYRIFVWEITEVSPDGKWVAHVRSGPLATSIPFEISDRASGMNVYRHIHGYKGWFDSHTPKLMLWFPDSMKIAYFFGWGEKGDLNWSVISLGADGWREDFGSEDSASLRAALTRELGRARAAKKNVMLAIHHELRYY